MVLDLLVVNPNSSGSMTEEIARSVAAVDAFRVFPYRVKYMTGPDGAPPQIDGEETSRASSECCLPVLVDSGSEYYYKRYDGILVACFSNHPLVAALRSAADAPLVVGLLNSSLSFVSLFPSGPYSIVTSNAEWVALLDASVEAKFLTGEVRAGGLWKGTVSTELQVLELHSEANFGRIVEVIRRENVERLGSKYVILGCAGFSGLQYRLNQMFPGVVFLDPVLLGFQSLLSGASFLKCQSI